MLVTLYSLLRNKFKEDENSFHMKRRLHELIFNKTSATASLVHVIKYVFIVHHGIR